jgi:predicted transcriptional regulator
VDLIEQLKVWKEINNYTWPEIAEMLEVPASTINNWVCGNRHPGAKNRRKIIKLIGA